MRSFYILNARASPDNQSRPGFNITMPSRPIKRERLRFRDMIWAYHSESQEILLSASVAASGGKMVWADAKALGVFLWLNNLESMVKTLLVSFCGRSLTLVNSELIWKLSHEISTCPVRTVIQPHVHCSTLHWAKSSSYMDYGNKPSGTENKTSCYNS